MIIDKIDKYLKRFTSNVEYGTRSRYYTLPTGVVRVSDHVGRNSNAVISIIITNKNDYILHKHSSGELSNISYNDLKKLVKSLGEYGSLFSNNENIKMIQNLKSDITNKNLMIQQLRAEVKVNNHQLKKPKADFIGAFRAFGKLTQEQQRAVCGLCNKTQLSELTPDELVTSMGNNIVQEFFKAKKN
jgi:hypothetical protein